MIGYKKSEVERKKLHPRGKKERRGSHCTIPQPDSRMRQQSDLINVK